jgi:poly-gamma-glutamate capsule biosynthesis protein CapA/YwtB (metallophosphatase superfamily)
VPPSSRIWLVVAAIAALGVLGTGIALLATDGDDDVDTAGSTSQPSTAPTTEATTTSTTRDPVLGNGQAVTLAFAGDTNFEGSAGQRLADDPASVLAPFAGVLSSADVAVVNMETAIGTGGTPAPKEFVFQAPAAALEAFRAAGVDVVSAANNHGMDFGLESLQETLAAEQASGFPIIGIGIDETEAYAPFIADVRGQRIAVIGATQVLDDSLIEEWTAGPGKPGLASAKRVDRLVQAVAEARAVADTVVVFLHWGIETQTCPSANQQELARALVDAGADVIVGGHAHRLQGGGRLDNAVVHYGLGNFGFQANSAEGARTGVFLVTITGRRVDGYQWVPGTIVDHQPRPLEGADADAAVAHWDSLRGCTGLTP